MRQVVILAGGKGTRLAERLNGLPKPLVDIDGVPLLQRQILALKRHGFGKIIVLVNYRADAIEDFLAANGHFGIEISCIDDGEPRGTAGAVFDALDRLESRFLVVYGDTLFDIDFDRFWTFHEHSGADGSLFLHPNDHPADSDLVKLDPNQRVLAFLPYPRAEDDYQRNLVNAALYVLERRIFACGVPDGIQDFGKDFFPQCLREGFSLRGYVSPEYIKDIGTTKRLDRAVGHLRAGVVARASLAHPQKAVLLDRDGTLNVAAGYIKRPEDLHLIPRTAEAISLLHAAEYRTVVVTNQPVIARGDVTVEMLDRIHAKLDTELGHSGAFLDRLYYCPHHPDFGFPGEVAALKFACGCRKPEIGLIEQARHDLNLDLAQSWLIGDSTADLSAARRAGVRSILVRTGEAGADDKCPATPDYEFADLFEAANFIVSGYDALSARLAPIVPRIDAGMLVRVVGRARVGKSTAAQVLVDELNRHGVRAVRVAIDAFIRPEDERPEDGGLLSRFDLALAQARLQPWLDGGSAQVEKPIYLRRTRSRSKLVELVEIAADTVVVLEGVVAQGIEAGARACVDVALTDSEARRADRFWQEYRSRAWLEDRIKAVYQERCVEENAVIDQFVAEAAFTVDLDAPESDNAVAR